MIVLQIMGNLGADPETRFTPSGQKVTSLRVACNSKKAGKEETIWWRVSVWGDRFDKMMTYLKKGSLIIAVGSMSKPEIYTKEGTPQVSLNMTAEMLMFPPLPKQGGDRQNSGEESDVYPAAAAMAVKGPSKQYDFDPEQNDNLPF
jgi:single-strand DNA-binding protein